MFEELEEIKNKCLKCQKCALAKTRTNIVFSDGNPNSNIVLVGEAPGYWEDQKGKPFVGKAGQLLDKIFECVGLSREKDVYICNTLKCRPPENRDPLPEEKAACKEYLDAQLKILNPKIILICGRVALNTFLPEYPSITKVRGKWFDGPTIINPIYREYIDIKGADMYDHEKVNGFYSDYFNLYNRCISNHQ